MTESSLAKELRTRLRQAVDSYTARGRRFAELGDDALDQSFVAAIKAWCASMLDPAAMREVNELSAEHILRRKDVPFGLVVDDLAFVLPAGGIGGVTGKPRYLRGEPVAMIVVVPSILGIPFLFAPFLALLSPNDDRYGLDDFNARCVSRGNGRRHDHHAQCRPRRRLPPRSSLAACTRGAAGCAHIRKPSPLQRLQCLLLASAHSCRSLGRA